MTTALVLAATMTIVGLGDSTTAGTPAFASPLEAPPRGEGNPESQYAFWMMKVRPAWTVLNRGVNGERADEIRARFTRDVEADPKDRRKLKGTPDGLHPDAATYRAVGEELVKALTPTSRK